MSAAESFFDTNILLYLLSGDTAKANRAEALIGQGGHISVQVLNEFASVASRKLKLSYAEIREILTPIRMVCQVHALTPDSHDLGIQLAEGYALSVYDALIVASAQLAGCRTLYSEDMQDGQLFGQTLRIRNPFVDKRAG